MFQLTWANKNFQLNLPSHIALNEEQWPVNKVASLVWEGYCVECAIPECYESFSLYIQPIDKHVEETLSSELMSKFFSSKPLRFNFKETKRNIIIKNKLETLGCVKVSRINDCFTYELQRNHMELDPKVMKVAWDL